MLHGIVLVENICFISNLFSCFFNRDIDCFHVYCQKGVFVPRMSLQSMLAEVAH